MLKTALIIGSDSDLPIVEPCIKTLKKFGMPFEVRVISAHRTPAQAEEFASKAVENGYGVIIAAAGKAAHLAGVLAAYTVLPVIAIPIKSSALDGLDALLSMVQMPAGIPVATVAIDGAANAAILACQILSLDEPELRAKLLDEKVKMAEAVAEKNIKLAEKIAKI